MVIDNQTNEPVVYRTEEDPADVPKKIRILLGLVVRALTALSLWPFRGWLGTRFADHKPMGEMCLPGGLCAGILMLRGKHDIQSTHQHCSLTVTVRRMAPLWESATLSGVDGKNDKLVFSKVGDEYVLEQE